MEVRSLKFTNAPLATSRTSGTGSILEAEMGDEKAKRLIARGDEKQPAAWLVNYTYLSLHNTIICAATWSGLSLDDISHVYS
jgi:hypothetical protein